VTGRVVLVVENQIPEVVFALFVREIESELPVLVPDSSVELIDDVRVRAIGVIGVSLQLLGILALLGEPFDEFLSAAPVCDTLARVAVVPSRPMNENDTFNLSPLVHRNTPQDVRFQWFRAGSIEMCWSYVGSWFGSGRPENRMT
jgi:hypothetical protein